MPSREDRRQAAARLVESMRGLVWLKANRFARHRRLEADGLAQVGFMAVIRSVRMFDPERGFKFSSYAGKSIMRAMANAVDAVNLWGAS